MQIVPLKQLVDAAQAGGYAVPHFNCSNYETIKTILAVAGELDAPLIVGSHPKGINYAGAKNLVDMTRNIGDDLDLDRRADLLGRVDVALVGERDRGHAGHEHVAVDDVRLEMVVAGFLAVDQDVDIR